MSENPFAQMIQEMVEQAARRAVELHKETAPAKALPDEIGSKIDLYRAYTAEEVAGWIGSTRAAVYKIPEKELRPTRTGPAGGNKRYLGINVLMYLTGQEPVDVEEIGRRVREQFIGRAAQPISVKPVPGLKGKVRVI